MVAVNPNRFGSRDAQPLNGYFNDAKSVLEGLFGPTGEKDLPVMAQAQIEATRRIREIAARKFGDADGEVLLEALCDAALRRAFVLPPQAFSAEHQLAYAHMREGQAQMIFMLLGWIAEGRAEQPPQREGNNAPSVRPKRASRAARKPNRKRR